MDVAECITKLVTTGAITRAIGDEALDMFRSSKAEYSKSMSPVSADAAAALEAAKNLRAKAANQQLRTAASVKTWRNIMQRIIDDPRGGMLQLVSMLSKDTLLGDNRLNALRRDNPEHLIFAGGSVDSNRQPIRTKFYNMLGTDIDKFRGKAGFTNAQDLIREIHGVDTGNKWAKTVAVGWNNMVTEAERRALLAGRQFEPNEHWFNPQPWESRRVAKFSVDDFINDFRAEIDSGGMKLWDKETNKYATAARTENI